MMYSAYKLNKQGDNIQPWHTSFPIWNQSVVPSPVLTVASWPAYDFTETDKEDWYSHLLKNFEVQAEIKIARQNNNKLTYTYDTTLIGDSEEEV